MNEGNKDPITEEHENQKEDAQIVPSHSKPSQHTIDDDFPLDAIPREVRQRIVTATSISQSPIMRGPDKLLERIPEEQTYDAFAKILALEEKRMDTEFNSEEHTRAAIERSEKRYMWLGVGAFVVFVLIIGYCLYLQQYDLATHLGAALGGIMAGGFGGYGLGKSRWK